MKLKGPLGLALVLGSVSLCLIGYAEERGRRAAPAPFQAHPAGVHPHGRVVPAHAVRVLAPKQITHGRGGWAHWEHPDFARPSYYWDWAHVHNVTCIAEDSYGDQYPVSEGAPPGFDLEAMTGVEDDALDRCYAESGQDTTCYLASCTHL